MIVLNEYTWAERAVNEHDLGKKPSETLSRVAKYYAYLGMKKRDVRKKLEEFLYSCDQNIVLSKWDGTLDRLTRNAFKYDLIMLDSICVTDEELEIIQRVDGKQAQRLAFTLLCIAKYRNEISGRSDGWVNTPDSEIMKMANIHTSIKRQCKLYSQLRDSGLIRFAKNVDNLSVQVLFICTGTQAIIINDFRNLGYQYDRHFGGPFYVCVNCGITDRIRDSGSSNHRPKKYCPDCAAKIKLRQNVESVMRSRKASKQNNKV